MSPSAVLHRQPQHDIQSARELHGRIAKVPTEERYSFLAEHFAAVAQTKINKLAGAQVHGPWDKPEPKPVDHRELAGHHLDVLKAAYGPDGHYALKYGVDGVARQLASGELMVWNLTSPAGEAANALATSALTFRHSGLAEMCRSAVVPHARGVGSAVQFKRLGDYFGQCVEHGAYRTWALESELWTRAAYTSPGGRAFPTSVETQHLNRFLAPFLLYSVVAYQEGGRWIGESQFDSRFYFQPERVLAAGPLFMSLVNPLNKEFPSMAEVAKAARHDAFGQEPEIIVNPGPNIVGPCTTRDIEYSMGRRALEVSGNYSDEAVRRLIANEAKRCTTGVIEFAVVNHPGNVRLQDQLMLNGFIPVGELPGGQFDIQGHPEKTTSLLHFQRPKPGLTIEVVPVKLADDYHDTRVGKMALQLEDYWRRLYPH